MDTNNNNNDDTKSSTESASIGKETVVQMPKVEFTKPAFFGKNCCKTILLICVVILLSFCTSVVTTKYSMNSSSKGCDDVTNSGVNCRKDHEDVQSGPVSIVV